MDKYIETVKLMIADGQVAQDVAEKFFPELKKSEDERMMHQLHSWMKEFGGAEEYTEKVYNWLQGLIEKQGEQKPAIQPKFKVGDEISKKHNSDINRFGKFPITCIRYGKYWYNDHVICDISEQDDWELVEQKPTDKIESHFYVEKGKWYMCIKNNVGMTKGNVYYGISDGYIIDDSGKKYNCNNWAVFQKYLRLWTIQDVKDGDVLFAKGSYITKGGIVMADRAEEKENRINSFALSFLERQQIVPNLYADQIVRGYKEGYHQAEKDLALTWEDVRNSRR